MIQMSPFFYNLKEAKNLCLTDHGVTNHYFRSFTLTITPDSTTCDRLINKAGYTVTEIARGWSEAVIKKVNQAFWQEQKSPINAEKIVRDLKRYADCEFGAGVLPFLSATYWSFQHQATFQTGHLNRA